MESQSSNRLSVVFNDFFCGTFLVHETDIYLGVGEPEKMSSIVEALNRDF